MWGLLCLHVLQPELRSGPAMPATVPVSQQQDGPAQDDSGAVNKRPVALDLIHPNTSNPSRTRPSPAPAANTTTSPQQRGHSLSSLQPAHEGDADGSTQEDVTGTGLGANIIQV